MLKFLTPSTLWHRNRTDRCSGLSRWHLNIPQMRESDWSCTIVLAPEPRFSEIPKVFRNSDAPQAFKFLFGSFQKSPTSLSPASLPNWTKMPAQPRRLTLTFCLARLRLLGVLYRVDRWLIHHRPAADPEGPTPPKRKEHSLNSRGLTSMI